MRIKFVVIVLSLFILGGCATRPGERPAVETPRKPLKVALVLGGGAAKGFAHVGVIKVLEANGIVPDIVVGTSAGSVVGALYAAGYGGFALQKMAMQLDESSVGDLALPNRGFIKGELLQDFINKAVGHRPIERLNKSFAAVATDLASGEMVAFQRGNTGMAVSINGREYVDGGLVSPVPVKVARSLGADVVIAVDISAKPLHAKTGSLMDILLQTFAIMGQSIAAQELLSADAVIRPQIRGIGSTDFEQKHVAIMEGEKAATEALPIIRSRLRLGRQKD
jgi:NTE family protein